MSIIHASATDVNASVPVVRLLARLDRVRRSGDGWTAKCPAHADAQASLSIAEGRDGRCLAHCFAGCRIADVVAALDLRLADLFVASRERRRWHG